MDNPEYEKNINIMIFLFRVLRKNILSHNQQLKFKFLKFLVYRYIRIYSHSKIFVQDYLFIYKIMPYGAIGP